MLYLLFISICIFARIVYCDECRSSYLRVEPDRSNVRLNGSMITSFSQYGPNLCFEECIRRPRCHSFNYNIQLFSCELNSEPLKLIYITSAGFDFVNISRYRGTFRDPCPDQRCVEGDVCVTLYNGNTTCFVDTNDSYQIAETTTTELETTVLTTTDKTTAVEQTSVEPSTIMSTNYDVTKTQSTEQLSTNEKPLTEVKLTNETTPAPSLSTILEYTESTYWVSTSSDKLATDDHTTSTMQVTTPVNVSILPTLSTVTGTRKKVRTTQPSTTHSTMPITEISGSTSQTTETESITSTSNNSIDTTGLSTEVKVTNETTPAPSLSTILEDMHSTIPITEISDLTSQTTETESITSTSNNSIDTTGMSTST